MKDNFLREDLRNYLATLPSEFDTIPVSRQTELLVLSDYIRAKRNAQQPIRVIVICTHNSRRSHMGQIWLQVAAACYEIPDFQAFSGGTEATAFHPNAIAAMRRTGLQIQTIKDSDNPIYHISFSATQGNFQAFSKVYTAPPNPKEEFAAVLVCTSADEACPSVHGADARISLPFDDPKAFDNTPVAAAKYDERARQIAREFFFVMQRV